GDNPNWYLTQVTVRDLQKDHVWQFMCNRWLAVDRGDFTTSCTLLPTNEKDLKQFGTAFPGLASKNMREDHLWLSIFSKPVESHFTRVQRLMCAFTLLLSYMLTKIMFFDVPSDEPKLQQQIGSIHISISAIVMGLECSLLMFPINVIIVQLFRLTKAKPSKLQEIDDEFNTESYASLETESRFDSSDFKEQLTMGKKASETEIRSGDIFFMADEAEGENAEIKRPNEHVKLHGEQLKPKKILPDSHDPSAATPRPTALDAEATETYILEDGRRKKSVLVRWKQHAEKDVWSVGESQSDVELHVKKKEPVGLPWWFLYINWTLCSLTSITCTYFIMLYGLKYGYQASIEWLTSILTSIFTSIVVLQPIKVVAMAILCALICKRKAEIDDRRDKIDMSELEHTLNQKRRRQRTF
ncbi:unnamed protein product, partial [Owenia fusiformis]